jgi:hypothetical protein
MPMFRLLLACAILTVSAAAQAQTTKPASPGEMAAQDSAKAEKRAACIKQSKEQERKLGFTARRKFVNACVKG